MAATQKRKAWSVVIMSTLAFTVCFMVWMMFAVIGIPIKATLNLNETQFGLLVSMPVVTGLLIRLPPGMLTDRYGGRIVFFTLMISTVVPIYLISYGSAFWHYLVSGLFVGVAGGSLLPVMFGALVDLTGVGSSGFMLMYGIVWISLIWMYRTEVRGPDLMNRHGNAGSGLT